MTKSNPDRNSRATSVDPVLLEVMKGEFLTIVEEMCAVIGRTARSVGAREGGDYTGALIHPNGQVIARAGVSAWYVGNTIPFVIQKYGDTLKPGDIVVHNDPYSGGTHLLDVVLIMPVFHEGKIIAYVGDSIHHTDFGGFAAGGMSTKPTELFQEGLLLPRVLLHDGGKPVTSVLEIIRANTRAPGDVMADLESQVAACVAAGKAVQRLAEKYGAETMLEYGLHLIAYTERAVREAIGSIPDGDYRAERQVQGTDDVPPINVVLTLRVRGNAMTIDFTGTDPQSESALNVPPSTVDGNVLRNFLNIFGIDVPSNSGLLTPIEIVVPEGTVLRPHAPAAVGARSAICIMLGDLLEEALGQAMPERLEAESAYSPILIYTPDTETGTTEEMIFDLWHGSTGARPHLDGLDGPTGRRRISAESMERDSSAVLEGYGLVPDTGGAGQFRGGLGTFRQWRFLAPGRLWVRNLRAGTDQPGRMAGGHGSKSIVQITTRGMVIDGSDRDVIEMRVEAGDSVYQMMGGGGGHGDPLNREPEKVAFDVLEGKVSADRAREDYAVVVTPDATVDMQATQQLRSRLSGTAR